MTAVKVYLLGMCADIKQKCCFHQSACAALRCCSMNLVSPGIISHKDGRSGTHISVSGIVLCMGTRFHTSVSFARDLIFPWAPIVTCWAHNMINLGE